MHCPTDTMICNVVLARYGLSRSKYLGIWGLWYNECCRSQILLEVKSDLVLTELVFPELR